MPATSKAQQRLMAAAAHGATFGKAKALRASMPMSSLRDFAEGSMANKPERAASDTPNATGIKHAPAKRMNAGKKPENPHPHKNLGKYLHPKKGL